jgi:cytochrome c peroxidase
MRKVTISGLGSSVRIWARAGLGGLGCLLLSWGLQSCGGSSSSTASTKSYPSVTQYLNIDPNNPLNYANPTLPVHYDAQVLATSNQTAGNVLSNAGATLGRVLFHDKRLSFNDTVSCASCHQQGNGFADTAQFSAGFAGGTFTSAHSMRLANAAFFQPGTMFWDKRASSLENQATQPIQNAVEMGFDATHGGFSAVITKMQGLSYYTELFTWVFGDSTITEARIQNALAQFERSMISSGSKWDTGYAAVYVATGNKNINRSLTNLTASEERGRALFINPPGNGGKGCAACHVPPTFALSANSRSNGLDAGETIIFKSPSLKNVALSGRFMHDGRFSSLTQVLDHYATGIQDGPALDNRLKPGGVPGVPMTVAERADIVAFLMTLTDTTLLSDARFTDPFK